MRTHRTWINAAALLGLLAPACIVSVTEQETGRKLNIAPAPAGREIGIAVDGFTMSGTKPVYEPGMVYRVNPVTGEGGMTSGMVYSGQEAFTNDYREDVAEALEDAGYRRLPNVSSGGVDYRIAGSYTTSGYFSARTVLFFLWDALVIFPALFTPVPIFGAEQGQLHVTVRDARGGLVDSRTVDFEMTIASFSVWGLLGVKGPAHAGARVASEIIAEHEQSGVAAAD